MSTADKLAKTLETKLNIKQAIIEKGVSVLDTDTFASYPEKIKAISGGGTSDGDSGGTKIFVKNNTNKKYVKGDKVLVTFSNNLDNLYSSSFASPYTVNFGYVTEDGKGVIYTGEYGKRVYLVKKVNNNIVTTELDYQSNRDRRQPYYFTKDYYIYKTVNNSKQFIRGITSNEYYDSVDFKLKEDLYYKTDTSVIHNSDDSLTYTTGLGNIYNTQKIVISYDNIIAIPDIDVVTLIDITNFPDCIQISKTLPQKVSRFVGLTGIEAGDYYIGTTSYAVLFFRFDGNNYVYDFEISLPSNASDSVYNVYMETQQGVVCVVDSDMNPRIFIHENGKMIEKIMSQDIYNKLKSLFKNNNASFSMNRNMDTFYVSSGVDDGISNIAGFIGIGYNTAIKDNITAEYNPEFSFTGFITGEVDSNGDLEVELLLTEEIDVTVVTNVNVTNDEIIFKGMK